MSSSGDLPEDLPKVRIIGMGGTIERRGRDRLDLARYTDADEFIALTDWLDELPELAQVGRITTSAMDRTSSTATSVSALLKLRSTIDSLGPQEADGIVITHGTDTLEETAFFLHLSLRTKTPVVVVGAMRPPTGLSPDGDLNLLNAAIVAGDPQSRGKGVLVVNDDRVYSARSALKSSTFGSSSFGASVFGPVGFVEAAEPVRYFYSPARPHTGDTEFDLDGLGDLPPVSIVTTHLGSDGTAVDSARERGMSGIVMACAGSAGITPRELEAVKRARTAGVAVCFATKSGEGRSILEDSKRDLGCLASDHLGPWKARILLSFALTRSHDSVELQRVFDTY